MKVNIYIYTHTHEASMISFSLTRHSIRFNGCPSIRGRSGKLLPQVVKPEGNCICFLQRSASFSWKVDVNQLLYPYIEKQIEMDNNSIYSSIYYIFYLRNIGHEK